MNTDAITEFLYLDTEELHLVGTGANGFAPLLAKAALEVDAVLNEVDLQSVLDEAGASKTLCDASDCEHCTAAMEKAKLKAKQRNALSDSDFALPGRRYPIHDESHARNALARVSQHGTPEEKAKVRAAVHRRYPNIGQEDAEKMLTQESGEHKAGNGSPEGSLGQTHENDTPEHGAAHLENGHEEGAPPSMPQPTPDQHQGGGDTAPDKNVPMGEALSQTNEVTRKAGSADGRGTPDPRSADEDAKTREEAESQTEEETRKADSESKPGSPAWEAKDIALAEKAANLLKDALEIVEQFGSREKAEAKKGVGEINVAINRATELLSDLFDGIRNQVATKEIDDMTTEELVKLLDERDAKKEADRAAKEEAAKKEELAKANVEGQTPATEETAPAVKSEEGKDETIAVSKSAWDELQARIANIENQPARPRPAMNDAGVRAGATAPAVRGQDQSGSESAFKALEDRVENARTPQEKQRFGAELLKAKAIAAERVREAQGPSRGPVALLAQAPHGAAAAAADFRG